MPAFGALVAEPLFLLADSAIVGRLGTAPLGGLGVAAQALTALVNVSIFLAYGTTAAVARQLGAGNRQAAIRQGIDGIWLAGAIGVVRARGRAAAGRADRPRVRRVRGGHRAGAVIYLRISLLGAPAMLAVLAGTGILRGLQDTRTPLVVSVAANVVNVGAERHVRARPALGHRRIGLGHRRSRRTARPPPTWPMVARGARRAGVRLRPRPGQG